MNPVRAFIFPSVLAATAFIGFPAMADENPVCPAKISVAQNLDGNAPEGWTRYDAKDDYPFSGVSFWSGTPDQKAQLAPSKEKRNGTLSTTATWVLPKSETAYWVGCEYSGTSVILAKPLEKSIDRCTVEYDNRFSPPVAKSWRCVGKP
jgi:hypothetical protein